MKYNIDLQAKHTIYQAAGEQNWDNVIDIHEQAKIAGTLRSTIDGINNREWADTNEALEYLASQYHKAFGHKKKNTPGHEWLAQGVFAIAGVLGLETDFMALLQQQEKQKSPTQILPRPESWSGLTLMTKHQHGIRQPGD